MSQVIYAFPLTQGAGKTTLAMPSGALILDVAIQHGKTHLWALVNPEAPKVNRVFVAIGTGFEIPDEKFVSLCHLKTVHAKPFVWHIFEEFTHVPAIKQS